jgi:hypothetical protein
VRRLVIALILVLGGLYLLARFVPVEPLDRRPGLSLVAQPGDAMGSDWSFIRPLQEIQLETRPWHGIAHSVTTVVWKVGEHLYVPCRACDTKHWPKNVAANSDVRLKIDGRLYPMRAVRISDEAERTRLLGAAFPETPADVWVYRMEPGAWR